MKRREKHLKVREKAHFSTRAVSKCTSLQGWDGLEGGGVCTDAYEPRPFLFEKMVEISNENWVLVHVNKSQSNTNVV